MREKVKELVYNASREHLKVVFESGVSALYKPISASVFAEIAASRLKGEDILPHIRNTSVVGVKELSGEQRVN